MYDVADRGAEARSPNRIFVWEIHRKSTILQILSELSEDLYTFKSEIGTTVLNMSSISLIAFLYINWSIFIEKKI